MTSNFLNHEPCPSCRSSDALAVYDDGHKYCFSCKYYERATASRNQIRKDLKKALKEQEVITLPFDFTVDIASEGLQWLLKYLTMAEIVKHRFGWSSKGFMIRQGTIQYAPLLVMPIFDVYENLLMWQARYFGSNSKCPKYWTKGNRGCFHILLNSTNAQSVVLTEDLLSSIKVSRHMSSMPIFGSEISNEVATVLASQFQNLIIWLDKDKRQYAHARAKALTPLFKSVKVVSSEADPKDYNDADIELFLFG